MQSDATVAPERRDSIAAATLAMFASQVSLNFGAAIAKHLFPLIGVEGITAFRVGFSALLLLALFRPWRRRLPRADYLNILIFGTVIGLMNLLIYRAFSRIPIGIAVAIEVTGPLLVALLASRRPRDIGACALAVVGLYLLLPLHAASALDPAGVAYAFGAAACWALYIVFGKHTSTLQGGQAVAWGMLAASLFIVPLGVLYVDAAQLTPAIVAAGFAIAVLSSAIPYSLDMVALRGMPRGLFGMFSSTAPALSALAGLLLLGERLSPLQWGAIACIMLASALSALSARSGR